MQEVRVRGWGIYIMKIIMLSLASLVGLAASTSASASTVVTTDCISVTDSAGCLFNGNINGNSDPLNVNSYLSAQNAYNAIRNPDIALGFITKSDDANFGTFGSITGGLSSSGTWSLPGFTVDYIAVKASDQFVLYSASGSSGNWDTFDIPFKKNAHGLSHLAFFGSANVGAVPEPATWAMMLLGFGFVGGAMRSTKRRQKPTFSYA